MDFNLTDPRAIRAALEQSGFHFSKARGQHFLTDPTVPERIASYIDASMGVLEIGPGFGALTKALCSRAGRVVSIEVDRRLTPILARNLAGCTNHALLEGDARLLDLGAITAEYLPGLAPVVAANLPYSITSEILTKLIESRIFGSLVVMVQAEVARRLSAAPGTKAYGSFTIFCRVHCEPEMLFDVPPGSFMPRPAVDSTVIRLSRRQTPLVPDELLGLFFRVVRAAFSQRRKTLKNALSAAFPPELATEAIGAAGASPLVRGETLGIAEFLNIAHELGKRL